MKKRYIKIAVISIVVIAVCAISYLVIRASNEITIDENAAYPVTWIMDGDTFKVQIGNKSATIRLLGIDTPETVDPRKPVQCYGKEASDETKSLLTGKQVKLKLNPHREVKDKYGRYLAYAYREDGLFINEYLVQNGYAREYTYGTPYSLQSEFRADQAAAQKGDKGLWGKCEDLK